MVQPLRLGKCVNKAFFWGLSIEGLNSAFFGFLSARRAKVDLKPTMTKVSFVERSTIPSSGQDSVDLDAVKAIYMISKGGSPPSSGGGVSPQQIYTFLEDIRSAKTEFSEALLNKMFRNATSKSFINAEEITAAMRTPPFAEQWKYIVRRAVERLSSSRTKLPKLTEHALKAHQANPGDPSLGSSLQGSEPTPPIPAPSASSTRKRHDHDASAEFPTWSVHQGSAYADNFDSLRVSVEGVTLKDAKRNIEEEKLQTHRRLQSSAGGAIVVPHSPRNRNAAVVVVDASAAQTSKHEIFVPANKVHEVSKRQSMNDAVLSATKRRQWSHDVAEKRARPVPPQDEAYFSTMKQIIDFLSSPRK